MKKGYWRILYSHNKWLLGVVLAFVLGQAFFIYKGVETTPFFNYGMYSEVANSKTYYTNLELHKDNELVPLEELSYFSSHFLAYQICYHQKMLDRDSIDGTIATIEQRFGKESRLTQYLTPLLTTSPEKLHQFDSWITNYTGIEDLQITAKKYQYIPATKFVPYETN